MRHSIELCHASRIRRIGIPLLFVTLFFAAPLTAQKGPKPAGPKYDHQTEAKFKGTIEEVKLPPKGSEREIVHITLKDGASSFDLYLCPKSFFDDMEMDFAKGDQITLTGSKIKEGEADMVLVREVAKGNNTFALRDDKGAPVWSN